MRILITGGAGYIGSHLVNHLIGEGHSVVTIDNFVSGKEENLPSTPIGSGKRQLWCGNNKLDITDFNSKFCELAFKTFHPDLVFHLAAVSRTPWAVDDPVLAYNTNVMGTVRVLGCALQYGVKKVVLASSNIVYAAQTPYKTSKLAMEQVARDYNYLYGLPTLCLRFSNVAGGDVTRQHDDNVLKSLAKSKKENGHITITGDGEQTRNFTNVNDICRALWLAAESDAKGDEIDIMHPKLWSLNEVAKFYDCEIRYVGERKGDIKHLKMGIGPAKAQVLLGFQAEIGLEDYISSYTNL